VIVIVAHWHNSSIQFFDSFYDVNATLDIVPAEKSIAIDLNVCTCKSLAESLGINRTFSLIKHNSFDEPSYAGAWFLFYKYFIQLISERDLTYPEALELTSDVYENIFL
jgi:hypothetical protein